MNYKMRVEIPVKEVPSDVSIQEARVTSELWLKMIIPDADLDSFNEVKE